MGFGDWGLGIGDVALERVKVQLKKANEKQNDHRAQPVSNLT